MRLNIFFAALFCVFAQGAAAETFGQLAAKSDFVRVHLDYLKRKDAVSVYASTKPYCPSVYWWSGRPASNTVARRNLRKHIEREMKQARFPKASIDHCVQNSGFVFLNRELQSHPKNASYERYVQPGILVVRKKGGGQIISMPVLGETNTYTDRRWRLFDANFKEICVILGAKKGIKLTCEGYGRFEGSWSENDGRPTTSLSNGNYDLLLATRREPSYAKKLFISAFGK